MIVQSKPIKSYNKKIGNGITCNRNIYSDLVGGCPSKKKNKPCVYCFNENLEQLYGFKRGFEKGFTMEELVKELLNDDNNLSRELRKIGIVRINANTDFYPEFDELYAEQIQTFAKYSIKVIAITKQDLIQLPNTMDAISKNKGVVHLTFNFVDKELAKMFEPDHYLNIDDRMDSLKYFLVEKNMKDNIVLRIAPVILGVNENDSYQIIKSFTDCGGDKVCIEFLRNPNKKLVERIKKYTEIITSFKGQYSDEDKERYILKIRKITDRITICGDYLLNEKYGYAKECCWI